VFPPALENYLKEIARVLKPGGRCFITFFLLNDEANALIAKGVSSQSFVHDVGGCYTTYLPNPEGALAFPEPYILALFDQLGLSIETPIRYGKWCGRREFVSYQDIIIATKK
jgi:SAM-dependent methyltransferase